MAAVFFWEIPGHPAIRAGGGRWLRQAGAFGLVRFRMPADAGVRACAL